MITPNTNEYHKNGHELGCRQKGCDQGIKQNKLIFNGEN